MADGKIKVSFIFEILGRPPEHLKETLKLLIEKLGEQKGIEISSEKIHEPQPMEKEEGEGLFTSFAEVELLLDNLNLVFSVVLNMLPANVEVIEPSELRLKNFELSLILSELTVKLHKYDEIAKMITLREKQLLNKIEEMRKKIEVLEKGNKDGSKGNKGKGNEGEGN